MHLEVSVPSSCGISLPVLLGRPSYSAVSRVSKSKKLVDVAGWCGVRETSRTGSLKDSAVTAVTWQLAIGIASLFGAGLDTAIV